MVLYGFCKGSTRSPSVPPRQVAPKPFGFEGLYLGFQYDCLIWSLVLGCWGFGCSKFWLFPRTSFSHRDAWSIESKQCGYVNRSGFLSLLQEMINPSDKHANPRHL